MTILCYGIRYNFNEMCLCCASETFRSRVRLFLLPDFCYSDECYLANGTNANQHALFVSRIARRVI